MACIVWHGMHPLPRFEWGEGVQNFRKVTSEAVRSFYLVREGYIVDGRVILLAGWSRNFEVKIKILQRVFLE